MGKGEVGSIEHALINTICKKSKKKESAAKEDCDKECKIWVTVICSIMGALLITGIVLISYYTCCDDSTDYDYYYHYYNFMQIEGVEGLEGADEGGSVLLKTKKYKRYSEKKIKVEAAK
jgi:hypothetical protein